MYLLSGNGPHHPQCFAMRESHSRKYRVATDAGQSGVLEQLLIGKIRLQRRGGEKA